MVLFITKTISICIHSLEVGNLEAVEIARVYISCAFGRVGVDGRGHDYTAVGPVNRNVRL